MASVTEIRAPRLKTLAAQIERDFPDLVAVVHPASSVHGGYTNTDRHPKGVRWRIPGKGRCGSKLVVSRRVLRSECAETGSSHDFSSLSSHCRQCGEDRAGVVFTHNAAETYRSNQDVVRWIEDEKRRREMLA